MDYFSGLGEVVKLHLMDGAASASWYADHQKAIAQREPDALLQSIVNSLKIKTGYLAEDEFDQGKRNLLNFGHCYGHALESVSHFAVPHGQAVLIGMLFAGIVARNRKLQDARFEQSVAELVRPHIVAPLEPGYFNAEHLLAAMRKDKKRVGQGLAVVLLSSQYQMSRISDLSDDEFRQAHDELASTKV
jgi:3-dehydroquinate synthase